jgi:hypothetical protein
VIDVVNCHFIQNESEERISASQSFCVCDKRVAVDFGCAERAARQRCKGLLCGEFRISAT